MEHLFEPWFANEAPCSASVKTQVKDPESIFDEASQPLAVRREDYVRRQSPIGRATESRSGNVAAEVERLVAYVELRHHGVERTGAADCVERPPLRDAALRRLERPSRSNGRCPCTSPRRPARSSRTLLSIVPKVP